MCDYTIDIVWNGDHRAYVASCREIPACLIVCETEDMALKMIHEAIEDHLSYLARRGRKAPLPLTSSGGGKS